MISAMAKHAFISHATKQGQLARSVVAALEGKRDAQMGGRRHTDQRTAGAAEP